MVNRQSTMDEIIYWFQLEFPDLVKDMKESEHTTNKPNPYHLEGSVWTHCMMVCQEARYDSIQNKLAALLHDLGKPKTRNAIERENIQKSTFYGHEGVSFWLAIEPLNRLEGLGCITAKEKEEILQMISLHGMLFQKIQNTNGKLEEYKAEEIVNLFETEDEFHRFIKQCKNDMEGRFYLEERPAGKLGVDLYNSETWRKYKKLRPEFPKDSKETQKTLTVLVGLPASGKSTYLIGRSNIVSRDEFIIQKGLELGLSYSEVFKTLSIKEQDEITSKTFNRFNELVREGVDIVIDMTNMSKKTRNRWSVPKGYNRCCIIFATSLDEIKRRNIERNLKENKFIPESVFTSMMTSFTVPTLIEFDSIKYKY